MNAPLLMTERLRIEPMTLAHWEAYAAAWADPRMTEFIGGEPRGRTTSWGKFLAGIGLWSLFGFGYWSFVDSQTGAFVGTGGLANFERGLALLEGYPEAGWAFVPEAWGKGYATEAMTAILQWADQEAHLGEIRCLIDQGNHVSHKVAVKLGFSRFAESHDETGDRFFYRRQPWEVSPP